MHRARGFTLIELLVTIAIIAVLIGMLFGALGLLKGSQRKVQTKQMMGQITVALIDYLGTYPILGDLKDDRSSDFAASPWTFLGRNQLAAGKVPYLGDVPAKFLSKGPVGGPYDAATVADADHILDAYTIADRSNRLVWAVVNGRSTGAPAFTYTDVLWIRSSCGSPAKLQDDLIMRLQVETGLWRTMSYAEATSDPTHPAPAWFW